MAVGLTWTLPLLLARGPIPLLILRLVTLSTDQLNVEDWFGPISGGLAEKLAMIGARTTETVACAVTIAPEALVAVRV